MDAYDSQPTPRQIPWKIILILGSILVLVVVVVILVLFLRGRDVGTLSPEELERTTDQVESAAASCVNASNPDFCRQQTISDAAVRLGAVEVCDMLSAEAYDECVREVAGEEGNAELCQAIVDATARTSCEDSLYRKEAFATNNAALCERLSDEQEREDCETTVARSLAIEGSCTGADTLCAQMELLTSIVADQDPDRCTELTDPQLQEECRDTIGPGDRDQDGLSATVETRYGTSDEDVDSDDDGLSDWQEIEEEGTDPLNPDTDGDSFSDGQEVSSGYNPLGPGEG